MTTCQWREVEPKEGAKAWVEVEGVDGPSHPQSCTCDLTIPILEI